MKAVIVDLVGGQAAALCDDGRVIRLADAGYTLGQVVEVHAQKPRRPKWLRYISSVAAAAVLVTAIGGGVAYATPYGVVSLDVNPSLEYTINRFDYVLSVEGVNEDGQEMLAEMDKKQLVHCRIGDAIEASVAQLEAGNWLRGESDEILLAAGTGADAHSERLIRELETDLCQNREGLEVRGLTVSREELDAARREGMSAGRRRMLHELSESEGEGFVPAEWADRPIRDILQQLDHGRAQESFRPDTREPVSEADYSQRQEQSAFAPREGRAASAGIRRLNKSARRRRASRRITDARTLPRRRKRASPAMTTPLGNLRSRRSPRRKTPPPGIRGRRKAAWSMPPAGIPAAVPTISPAAGRDRKNIKTEEYVLPGTCSSVFLYNSNCSIQRVILSASEGSFLKSARKKILRHFVPQNDRD